MSKTIKLTKANLLFRQNGRRTVLFFLLAQAYFFPVVPHTDNDRQQRQRNPVLIAIINEFYSSIVKKLVIISI